MTGGSRVAPLEAHAQDDPQWLAFLETQPAATAFHHPAWSRVLAETYGYRPFTIVQTDPGGQIVAGLPVLEVADRRLASLPFTDHCPPLTTPAVEMAPFTLNLLEWGQAAGQPGLVVHDGVPSMAGIHHVPRGVRHILAFDESAPRAFAGLGGKVRSSIRKAQREGLRVRVGRSAEELEAFYRLHLETRRRLGVPVQPRRFMENLFRHMVRDGLGFVIVAWKAEQPIAAALFLAWNGQLIYKFSASDPRYWALCPNNLVIWTAIEWGYEHQYRFLDFGRSDADNHGLREFKSRWGATEIPLAYSYLATAPPRPTPKLLMAAVGKLIQWSPPVVCRAMGELLYGRAAVSMG